MQISLRHSWNREKIAYSQSVVSFAVRRSGNQSTRHTVNSSHRKTVGPCRVDRRVWRSCDELTVLSDIVFDYSSHSRASPSSVTSILHTLQWLAMLYMYVQCLVSFKFQCPQITVVTSHPCYDTVTLNANNETELHAIAVALLGDDLTVWRDAYVTSWLVADGQTPTRGLR